MASPCPDANTRLLRVRQNPVPARGAMCTDTIPSSSKKNGNRLATSTNCVGFTCVLSRGLNFQTPHSIQSWTCLNSRHCRSSHDTPKKPTNHTLSHSDEAFQICAKTHACGGGAGLANRVKTARNGGPLSTHLRLHSQENTQTTPFFPFLMDPPPSLTLTICRAARPDLKLTMI